MAIINLFSKRQKELRGEIPDVYTYEDLPRGLRVQICHIWEDTLGNHSEFRNNNKVRSAYQLIVDSLCREYGLFQLPAANKYADGMYQNELIDSFLQESDIEKQLDIVELSFNVINTYTRNYEYLYRPNFLEIANNAIEELNCRFKEHGIGFQFIENEIVRVDSELIHVEAVKPALRLLNDKKYNGPQQEFLSAYEHYRHGRHKEALNDCLKSFESTMRAICDKQNWSYSPNATAKDLIQVCFTNNLIPKFWQQQFASLRSTLESGIPTGRNKLSGHGQGTTPTVVPDYLVAYMLHMTASTLLFLILAEKKIK
ncbi:STM4504/CBY_0614 family protein [Nitrosomonas marina]|uniref:Abortive infection C-terminus n=1 Tax=Nitrosomonas marina TaxID=917 RepID=A0A1H8CHE7_9PROT|nr:hypothetical protein [Nitrosomonas marina]SEM93698.1 hypothetical protein SAMN05216325_104187 [Nitrosomonas marina]